jgi:hypothetical protein
MKAYLDSCIFIVYAEKEMSNSHIIIEAAKCGLFSPVISFHTIYEMFGDSQDLRVHITKTVTVFLSSVPSFYELLLSYLPDVKMPSHS